MPSIRLVRWLATVFCLYLAYTNSAFAKPLIMTAPPRENPQAGAKLYGPLAEQLKAVLGRDIIYQHPKNWLNYQRDMRNDVYDIVFDGPHFAAWRIAHLGHTAAVKLPGTLEFFLLRAADNEAIQTPDDLIGKKICGISPPNLSTLSVLARFDNPVRQPVIRGIKGGMGKVYKRFMTGACDALVLRNAFFKKKLKKPDQEKLKVVYHSKPLPNQVITVSKRVSAADKQKLAQAIVAGSAAKSASGIRKRFGGKKAKSFLYATQQEYTGHNVLLEGVIFGW